MKKLQSYLDRTESKRTSLPSSGSGLQRDELEPEDMELDEQDDTSDKTTLQQ